MFASCGNGCDFVSASSSKETFTILILSFKMDLLTIP
jgi:hypothetical protein